MSVNDLEVNFDNIDSIISAITSPKYVSTSEHGNIYPNLLLQNRYSLYEGDFYN